MFTFRLSLSDSDVLLEALDVYGNSLSRDVPADMSDRARRQMFGPLTEIYFKIRYLRGEVCKNCGHFKEAHQPGELCDGEAETNRADCECDSFAPAFAPADIEGVAQEVGKRIGEAMAAAGKMELNLGELQKVLQPCIEEMAAERSANATIFCGACGWTEPRGNEEGFLEHLLVCEKHPLARALEQRKLLGETLIDLVNMASTPDVNVTNLRDAAERARGTLQLVGFTPPDHDTPTTENT